MPLEVLTLVEDVFARFRLKTVPYLRLLVSNDWIRPRADLAKHLEARPASRFVYERVSVPRDLFTDAARRAAENKLEVSAYVVALILADDAASKTHLKIWAHPVALASGRRRR